MLAAEPVLTDVRRAGELIPALDAGRLVLHAGPPLEWRRMCAPLRGAVCGAVVFEGWAPSLAAAEELAAAGGVEFAPNHHHGAVGPMTGITTRSMPLLVVENRAFGNRAACALNEGLGKVLRFGANDAEVLARLGWLRDELGPLLGTALRAMGGIPLNPLIARGLAMGDEMHQRNVACTSLFLRTISPHLARAGELPGLIKALEFIGANDQFFLNIAMAMGKCIADPASGVPHSTVVTTMSRNGTDFGIRVAGLGERWLTAPVEMPRGLFFPGYTAADANPGHRRLGDPRGGRAGRVRDGGGAGGRGLRRRRRLPRRARLHARDGRARAGAPGALADPGARVRRRAARHRRAARGRDRRRARHQHRHRAPRGGGGPGRRRHRPRAACLLRAGLDRSGMTLLFNQVQHGRYLDSVALMRISRELGALPGVEAAALMIGTPSNKALMREAGLLAVEGERAGVNDLVIAVRAGGEAAAAAAARAAEELLSRKEAASSEALPHARSLDGAVELLPGANLALVSVPGEFAALEARKCLQRGLHVLVFSDNVPLEEEVALKLLARDKGLLLMGPDCGTALIAGTPVAFANAVPRGDIGIVSASGTGLQEVSTLIARLGAGVSHGIGVGGRDLDARVGALGTFAALDALERDAATKKIVLISKPPAPEVARQVLARVKRSAKLASSASSARASPASRARCARPRSSPLAARSLFPGKRGCGGSRAACRACSAAARCAPRRSAARQAPAPAHRPGRRPLHARAAAPDDRA